MGRTLRNTLTSCAAWPARVTKLPTTAGVTRRLPSWARRGFRKQIENTNEAIARITGKRPVLMRPPYGATSSFLNKRLSEEYGLKVILWSVDPLDWRYRNSNRVFSSIVQNTQPGSIILTHDIHATTVAAMPETLDALLGQGIQICDGVGADCHGSSPAVGQERSLSTPCRRRPGKALCDESRSGFGPCSIPAGIGSLSAPNSISDGGTPNVPQDASRQSPVTRAREKLPMRVSGELKA